MKERSLLIGAKEIVLDSSRLRKNRSVHVGDGYYSFEQSGAIRYIVSPRDHKVASKEYHEIEVRRFETPDKRVVAEVVFAKMGACWYVLQRNEVGFYEEVAGPYHYIEFSGESGMLQATTGIEGQPGFIAEVLDPLALPTEAISR